MRTPLAHQKNIPLLALGWRHGTLRDRLFIAYFVLWSVLVSSGFVVLMVLQQPFDLLASYAYVLTLGLFMYPVWYAPFLNSAPVLRAILQHPAMDHARRPLFRAMLTYAERFGTGDRFPHLDRTSAIAAAANALFPPITLLFVWIFGTSQELGRASLTPILYAAVVFPSYLAMYAVTMRTQRRFAQQAEGRGYPIWSLARRKPPPQTQEE